MRVRKAQIAYVQHHRPSGQRQEQERGQPARFLRRYKSQLKRAVADSVNRRSITDIDSGEKVGIPSQDISEPIFHHGPGGSRDMVHPGNKDFLSGDRVKRPEGGEGGGSGQGKAGKGGQGEDDFVFNLSREEYLDLLFEDLELPRLVRNQLLGTTEFKYVRAGYTTDGNPSNIDVVRSLKGAVARRTALGAPHRGRIRELEDEVEGLLADGAGEDDPRILALREEIDRLKTRIAALPFIDTFDLRYQAFTKRPEPTSKAVMFCIMDVSGSMDQVRKNLAKRFFILLYLFLQRNYKNIDVVFIRHHTIAQEVDEQEFFYSRETGGTVVSSALNLADDVIETLRRRDLEHLRGPGVGRRQLGFGFGRCREILTEKLVPLMRYFAYVEITPRQHQSSGMRTRTWLAHPHFAMEQIGGADDIYPVFRALFKRQSA